jgi:hypothetical protein
VFERWRVRLVETQELGLNFLRRVWGSVDLAFEKISLTLFIYVSIISSTMWRSSGIQ